MKRCLLAWLIRLGVGLGPAAWAEEDALVVWLLKDGGRARATREGYMIYPAPKDGAAALYKTREGFRVVDRAGRSATLYRNRQGFSSPPGVLWTNGLRVTETADGYIVATLKGTQATMRRTSEGYSLTGRAGRSVVVRRTDDSWSAAPGAPRDSGLGAAFDAAYKRRNSKGRPVRQANEPDAALPRLGAFQHK